MKKRIITVVSLVMVFGSTMLAGGLMTNTNYHIAFDRMFARGATTDIDAAYSNPAGLVWGHEGLQLSLNFQKPWQNRDIETFAPNYLAVPSGTPGFDPTFSYPGYTINQKYGGKASAPIVPALFASYKKDRWAVSTMIGIVGSGGYVEYKDGIPMFSLATMAKLMDATKAMPVAMGGPMTPDKYYIDSEMKGKQYIYGAQANFTYKVTDFLAAAVGVRANYYDGFNRGHVLAAVPTSPATELINLQLDCLQKGWGVAPIVSVDFHQGPLTLSARYEFRTKIYTKNDTKTLYAKVKNTDPATMAAVPYVEGPMALAQFGDKVAPYQDGARTRYDMPSLLVVAADYEFTPKLRASLEYHFFDDRHAEMANKRQKELKHGTHEILAGVEYDINEKFTVSCGGQRTDYGLSDGYQTNTSFACDSYSLGCGGAFNVNDHIRINASYFCSLYSDYKKTSVNYLDTPYPGIDTYSRTNHVIGVGVDYKF